MRAAPLAPLAFRFRGAAILTVNHLPDSRRAILIALKRRGVATIAALAEELQLTGEAVRQQLLQLQQEAWVEPRPDAQGVRKMGRPATQYKLTAAGDHLFPKGYDALGVAMIDAVVDEFGEDAARRILARIADQRVNATAPAMKSLDMEQRLDVLRNWYAADDPHMAVEKVGADYRLVERNCPFLNVALNRPALCSVSVNALTRLLGVRVDREEKFQNGDGRCVFRVHTDEPIDAEKWTFRFESEMA